jgi:hypothetical protein
VIYLKTSSKKPHKLLLLTITQGEVETEVLGVIKENFSKNIIFCLQNITFTDIIIDLGRPFKFWLGRILPTSRSLIEIVQIAVTIHDEDNECKTKSTP